MMFRQALEFVGLICFRAARFGNSKLLFVVGFLWVCRVATIPSIVFAADTWSVVPHDDEGTIEIRLHDKPFATYAYRDPAVPHPYFANVFAPSGVKITKNHPPTDDDLQDPGKPSKLKLAHPGIWLAFSDLNGADSWRLSAPVEHVRFVSPPRTANDTLTFSVENKYLEADRQHEICREQCNFSFQAMPDGVLLIWDSTFQSDGGSILFGDQEEMGLAVELAKAVSVETGKGGRILNSNNQKNQQEAFGNQAEWCDYSGEIDNQFVGIQLLSHPGNFRRPWCQARDYGLIGLNPFGKNAYAKESDRVTDPPKFEVPKGESLRIRYGVLVHWNDNAKDFNPWRSYQAYLRSVAAEKELKPGLVGVLFDAPDLSTRARDILVIDLLDQTWEPERIGKDWSICWEGYLVAPTDGEVTFELESNHPTTVAIGDKSLRCEGEETGSASLLMHAGELYPISFAISKGFHLEDDDKFRLTWRKNGDDTPKPIGGTLLRHWQSRPKDLQREFPSLDGVDPAAP